MSLSFLWFLDSRGKLKGGRQLRAEGLTAIEIVRAQDHFGASGDMLLWRLQNESLIKASDRKRLKSELARRGGRPDGSRIAPLARNAVLDTSLILSLGGASALDLLWDDPEHIWHISPIVRGKVISEPSRSQISRAILDGHLIAAELDTDSAGEMNAFAERSRSVHPGEAEAIAIGVSRSWTIGIEDRFVQRRLTSAIGPQIWVNAAGLLVADVRTGRRSPSDADALFTRLDCYSGYAKRGVTTLSDLLD